MLQGLQLPLQGLLDLLIYYLNTGWGIVILIGTFASAILIAVGFIYWCTGLNPKKGRKMVIGGVILFVTMQWLAFNTPWQVILG
ncbi:MAG: hypothetical protein ACFE89_08155 [Candidatus Hodarchaeota archaeon]